jgi:hypothetical protein
MLPFAWHKRRDGRDSSYAMLLTYEPKVKVMTIVEYLIIQRPGDSLDPIDLKGAPRPSATSEYAFDVVWSHQLTTARLCLRGLLRMTTAIATCHCRPLPTTADHCQPLPAMTFLFLSLRHQALCPLSSHSNCIKFEHGSKSPSHQLLVTFLFRWAPGNIYK